MKPFSKGFLENAFFLNIRKHRIYFLQEQGNQMKEINDICLFFSSLWKVFHPFAHKGGDLDGKIP